MTQKHTPGPWKVLGESHGNYISVGVEERQICKVNWNTEAQNEAGIFDDGNNAHLIAAAPELLEALEVAQRVIDELMPGAAHLACDIGLINDGCIKMDRAIAKARGQS